MHAYTSRAHWRPVDVHISEVNRTPAGRQAANPVGAITSMRTQPMQQKTPCLQRPSSVDILQPASGLSIHQRPVVVNRAAGAPSNLRSALLVFFLSISSSIHALTNCFSPHILELITAVSAPTAFNLELWREPELRLSPLSIPRPVRLRA